MRNRNRQWWIGLAAGFLLGQLFYGGAALMLGHAVANGQEEEPSYPFSFIESETVQCACDNGHEWEDVGTCGVHFVVLGQRGWGPYCPHHIGEFLDDNIPKAWVVDDGE